MVPAIKSFLSFTLASSVTLLCCFLFRVLLHEKLVVMHATATPAAASAEAAEQSYAANACREFEKVSSF